MWALHYGMEENRNNTLSLYYLLGSLFWVVFMTYMRAGFEIHLTQNLIWLPHLEQDLLVENKLLLANLGLEFYILSILWPCQLFPVPFIPLICPFGSKWQFRLDCIDEASGCPKLAVCVCYKLVIYSFFFFFNTVITELGDKAANILG